MRNAYISYLFNQVLKITNPSIHKEVFVTKFYNIKSSTIYHNDLHDAKKDYGPFAWHAVEKTLDKEISWLKERILIMTSAEYKNDRLSQNCDDCFFRKLAILIVSNKVKATEFKTKNGKALWSTAVKQEKRPKMSRHGEEWHRKMMDKISEHFRGQGYEIISEPTLNYGRSDLGIYSDNQSTTYIEIGTVSLFKLWYNLSIMKSTTFLLAPTKEYLIEFKT